MLEWILNPHHVLGVLITLAVATPLAGAGWMRWRHQRRAAWALGIAGPALLVMWFAFNSIQNTFGLDSLAGMGLNAMLFVLVGMAAGAWLAKKG